MKKILLTQGKVAKVDNADYKWLNQWKWYAHQIGHTFYAECKASIRKTGNIAEYERKNEMMHRLILGLQPGDKREIDHRDGNGINNQRNNLRICTHKQNGRSRRKQAVGTSKYKGVSWNYREHRWRSDIRVNGKLIYLGCFSSEKTAAKAYNKAALKHFGEFALLNTP